MKKMILCAMLLAAAAGAAMAQAAPGAEQKLAEMKKLDKLVGTWKGSGWIQRGKERENFTGAETVQSKLGGLAVLVEGKHFDAAGKVIHETLAVLSYNPQKKAYDFATYLANGVAGVNELKAVGDHYEWGFEIPNFGTMRYTIRIENNKWLEIGEISRDGGNTWTKNFEMTLDKTK